MRSPALKPLALSFALALTATLTVRADILLNSFDTPFDYVANGIVGDTNWDGVYLRGGDIPGGSLGGSGSGNQTIANTTPFGGGFLGLRNAGGDWSGADNDGFFIYKLVSGDFDVSVDNLPATLEGGTAYDNRANHFAGLQIRAYHTNNSGAPYSASLGNNTENSYRLWRFNQFNIDGQIRRSTNGANGEFTYASDPGNLLTSDPRSYRIVRENGTNFYFYWRTNSFDSWVQITNGATPNGVAIRSDWAGVSLQVGIAQAAFSTGARDALFDNFVLSGAGVTFPSVPAGPTALVTTATNIGGSLTFAWQTNGCFCGENYLVVMSTRPIQHNPVQGVTYVSSNAYGTASARIGGAAQFVVHNGPEASVTVTNLGANNVTYYVAVYSYITNSPPVYSTASPATGTFFGPGIINSVTLSVPDNDIPTNGAVALRVLATFSTGESSDQTANTTWDSSDQTVAVVSPAGVVSGINNGVATITATFGAFTPSTNITVHSMAFTEDFASTNNYVANGILGSPFEGLYLNFGDVSGSVAGGDGQGTTPILDSRITSANGLYMSSVLSTWSDTANDGPFLYKIVPGSANAVSGDFQAVVHINTMNTLNGVVAGLMARVYNPANHGPAPGGLEHHVELWKVQNGTTSARRTQNQAGNNTTTLAGGTAVNWLMITRVNSTNFYFFEKANGSDQWNLVTSTVLAAAANNAPMEVGLAGQSTLGVNQVTVFDSFMLDAAGLGVGIPTPPPATNLTMVKNLDLSMSLTWVAESNGVPVPSIAVMRANAPVTAQPVFGAALTGNSVFGSGTHLGGGNYVVYVSPASPPSITNTVSVTGLAVGTIYHAAIYTFGISGGSNVYNNIIPPTGASDSLLQGFLTGFTTVTPAAGVPRRGVGPLQVIGNYEPGSVKVDNTAAAAFSSGDTNIFQVVGNLVTGFANGTTTLTTSFGGFTAVQDVTVRPPDFEDEFNVNHDYLTTGVTGSGWHGMYDPNAITNPIPGSPYVPLAGSGAIVADANVSSNGLLSVTAAGDGWENAAAGGFFLYRYVPGDFQAMVQIQSLEVAGFNQPGLLARAYGVATNGDVGAPFGTVVTNAFGTNNLGEYWVSLSRFDEFNIGTYARRNLNSAVLQSTQNDQGDTNYWLLIVRSKGTEFDFYKRYSETEPWRQVPNKTHYSIAQFAGQPMQVGIAAGPFTGVNGAQRTTRFERFMLDGTSGSPLQITKAGVNATLSWPPIPGALESTDVLPPFSWQPVAGSPTLGTNGYSLNVPINFATNKFFRLVQ
jgi:hypothetical protein